MSSQTQTPSRSAATSAPSIPAARSATGTVGSLTWSAPSGEFHAVSIRPHTPEPRLRQLMGVCGWAAILGCIGLLVAVRGIFGAITGTPPSWYEPTAIAIGLTGLALTVAAFVSVQRRLLPWFLLSAATVFLTAALFVTATAF